MPAVLVSWGCRTNDHKQGVKPTHTYSLTVWWPKSMAGFTALRSGCRQGRSPWSSRAEPGSLPCLGPGGCPPSTTFSPPASLVTSLLGCLHTPCASLFSANPGPSPHLKILILVVSAESLFHMKSHPQVPGLGPGYLWRPPHQSRCRKGSVIPVDTSAHRQP